MCWPTLRCYAAQYARAEGRYQLLLADISATHQALGERPPNRDYGLALAEALANLHAHWWGPARLGQFGAPIHGPEHLGRFVRLAAQALDPMIDGVADQLEPHWPDLIQEVLARLPETMLARSEDLGGFTLIHGDVGTGNVMVPRRGHRPVYLIDRQPFASSLSTWLGVYDLAYALVLDWDTAIRRACESHVLEHYHQQLLARGVEDYPWERLLADYRLCVVMSVAFLTEYCRGKINAQWRHMWLPYLRKALSAIEDHDCRQLWSK